MRPHVSRATIDAPWPAEDSAGHFQAQPVIHFVEECEQFHEDYVCAEPA
jgi:hypothetical protein